MKRLFICERPYPLYRTLIKCADDRNENDIIISNHVEGMERMYPVLKNADIFKKVFFYDDKLYQNFYSYGCEREFSRFPGNIFVLLKKLYKYIELQHKAARILLPEGLDFDVYDEIYVNDAASALMLYLCSRKKRFIWVEHAKNVFQVRLHTVFRICFGIMPVLERLGIAYSLHGTSRWVEAVEVNNNADIIPLIKKKKIIEVDIDRIIENMPDRTRNYIFDLYCRAYDIKIDYKEPVYIILTNPLFEDGFVSTEAEQAAVIRNLIKQRIGTYDNVLIKPHPRDETDYKKYFPDVSVSMRCISAEIFSLASAYEIKAVYGFMTSSITAFGRAKHTECFTKEQTLSFLKNN